MLVKITFWDKRAMTLLEWVMKILIAVICVGILISLGYLVYDSFAGDETLKQAKTFSNELNSKINAFESSNLNYMKFLGFPPAEWYLKSFDILGEGHPAGQCVGRYKSCLCVCSKADCSDVKGGACRGAGYEIFVDGYFEYDIPISGGDSISMGRAYSESEPVTRYQNTIKLESPTELNITKSGDKIKITQNKQNE